MELARCSTVNQQPEFLSPVHVRLVTDRLNYLLMVIGPDRFSCASMKQAHSLFVVIDRGGLTVFTACYSIRPRVAGLLAKALANARHATALST